MSSAEHALDAMGVPDRNLDVSRLMHFRYPKSIGTFLERADKYYRWLKQAYGSMLSLKPTEYFTRQVYATFIDDPMGLKTYHMIGPERLG